MAAYRTLSNPADRQVYDDELRGTQDIEDLDTTMKYEMPMGMRRLEKMSAPPKLSLTGGQAMTGRAVLASENPLRALLRPATVINTTCSSR